MPDLRCATLPARLREARLQAGLGRYQLALRAELGEACVRQIESGRSRIPGVATVERLALALGVDPCWLAYGPTS